MRIGDRRDRTHHGHLARMLLWAGVCLLILAAGVAIGGLGWREFADLLRSTTTRLIRPASKSASVTLPLVIIDMDARSYNEILVQRGGALSAGVYIPRGQDFVTATIRLQNGDNPVSIPVRVRLIEGPADHLRQGNKWSFEIRTRQNTRFLGLERFYLQDPASNNWINQRAFSRSLEMDGILTAGCQFVRLTFNGENWGIYALQEGFTDELLVSQGRPGGIVLRFDPDPLWKSIARAGGELTTVDTDPIGNLAGSDFQYFEIDTFRDAAIAGSAELATQQGIAVGMLRALQSGELNASDVFDVDQYGRFLALVDLWGASAAASLVNIRYYYNPETGRLEPIAFNGNPLSSEARLALSSTFDDPVIQAAYAREAARISEPEYLELLQDGLDDDLRTLRASVAAERPHLGPPWDLLRRRQEHIRFSLETPQHVFAYLGSPTLSNDGVLQIDVGNVLNLPVEIVGFDIHGTTFLPVDRQWLVVESREVLVDTADHVILPASGAGNTPIVRYVQFDIPLREIHQLDTELELDQDLIVQVATRIWGLPTLRLTPARSGYPDILILGGAQ